MKRIGTIAAKLIANPIELVAAANQKRGTEFDGAPLREERESEAPRRSVGDAHPTRATRMGKEAEPGGPASEGGTAANRRNAALRLVSNRDRRTASAANTGRSQRPAVRLSLVLVSGGHARTTPW